MSSLRPPEAQPARRAAVPLFIARFPGAETFLRLVGRGGDERVLRARLSALMALAARGSTLLTLLFLIPASREALGPERFGLWMLLGSLPIALAFADLGIGNGVMSAIAVADGRDDRDEMRRIASNGQALLIGAAAALLAIYGLAAAHVDWGRVFNVHDPLAVREASQSAAVVAISLALTIAAALTSKVQTGQQEGVLANSIIATSNVASFVAVFAALKLGYGVPVLAGLLIGLPAVIQVLAAFGYFAFVHPDLRPRIADVDPGMLRLLVGSGLMFFFMQICSVANSRFDAFLVAQYASSSAAGLYLTFDRLFALAAVLPVALLTPLWPAYAEAHERGDLAWIRRTFWRSTVTTLAFTIVVSLGIVATQGNLLSRWFPAVAEAPWWLVGGFAVWKIFDTVAISGSVLLNGAGRLKAALAMLASSAVLSIGSKLLVVPYTGPFAIVWLTAAITVACSVAPLAILVPRIYRGLERRSSRR
jgi:O-antigen/teichoic acid export membrane protein